MAATLPASFRKHWRELQRGQPGRRFESRYERARQATRRGGAGHRILIMTLALVMIAIGVVLLVIPGPGIPVLLIGGGLLATESRTMARFMDWCEVKGRKIAAWAVRRWKRMPLSARFALSICGLCGSAGMAYVTYQLLRT
jgi:hypothetical protein